MATIRSIMPYQGNKQRFASVIAGIVMPHILESGAEFVDGCSGTGVVSVELVANHGVDPRRITMVEMGDWALVWDLISQGAFDTGKMEKMLNDLNSDPKITNHRLRSLAEERFADDGDERDRRPYVFLALQSGSFGGRPVYYDGSKWVHQGFRAHSVSNGSEKPVMSPCPQRIMERLRQASRLMRGVRVVRTDVVEFLRKRAADGPPVCVYLDPPYGNKRDYIRDDDIGIKSVEALRDGSVPWRFFLSDYTDSVKSVPCVETKIHQLGSNAKQGATDSLKRMARNSATIELLIEGFPAPSCSREFNFAGEPRVADRAAEAAVDGGERPRKRTAL